LANSADSELVTDEPPDGGEGADIGEMGPPDPARRAGRFVPLWVAGAAAAVALAVYILEQSARLGPASLMVAVFVLSAAVFAPVVRLAAAAPVAESDGWSAGPEAMADAGLIRATVTGAPVVLFAVDSDGTFTLSEGQGLKKLGFSPGEVVGRSVFEVYGNHPEILGYVRRVLAGESISTTLEVGGLVFQTRYQPARDAGGRITGLYGVATDITDQHRTEDRLKQALSEQEVVLNNALVAILHVVKARTMTHNRRMAELFGYSEAELDGLPIKDLYVSSTEYAEDDAAVRRLFPQGEAYGGERLFRRKDGSTFWARFHGKNIDADDLRKGAIWVIEDVTKQREAEEGMRLAATVFETTNEGIMVTDADNVVVSVNPAFTEITGYHYDEAVGDTPRLLRSGRHDREFYRLMWRTIREKGRWEGEIWNRRKDGTIYPQWLSIATIRNETGGVEHYVGVFADLSKRKEAEEQLHYQANYDALTGLPNRQLLRDRLTLATQRAVAEHRVVALVYLDIDNFKIVNDSLGHALGDRLLVEMGRRIASCVRAGDTVARLGGDEFMIILPDLTGVSDSTKVVRKILESVAQPLGLDNQDESMVLTASAGIAIHPYDGVGAEDLMRNADTACFHAKEKGRSSYQYFTDDMNLRALERLSLESKLRRAVEREEFVLHYQPKVDLRGGRLSGLEALIRWDDPESGLIAPSRFIPLAEETGLIVPIGEWALRQACTQAKAWQDAGFKNLRIAVNLSGRQFHKRGLFSDIEQILEETGLAPESLELEITESAIMENTVEASAILARLADLGVRITIDDFGTGYSSLSYLRGFRVDALKIDRSFVVDIDENGDGGKLAAAVVAIAQSLNLRVVAEGVETEAQLAFLRQHWCDEMQGYLYSRPLPADEMEALLRESPRL
jgi:diguanylate cyclase (GGDEF)-like protein/PAS domain S-box-containing protein